MQIEGWQTELWEKLPTTPTRDFPRLAGDSPIDDAPALLEALISMLHLSRNVPE